MKSTLLSFLVGIVTALAIVAGFAGSFMERTAQQRTDELAARFAMAAPVAPIAPVLRREAARPAPARAPAPSTSGLASPTPVIELERPRPESAAPRPVAVPPPPPPAPAVPASTGAQGAHELLQATAPATALKREVRKSRPKSKKRLDSYEQDNVYSRRDNPPGLFGIFR